MAETAALIEKNVVTNGAVKKSALPKLEQYGKKATRFGFGEGRFRLFQLEFCKTVVQPQKGVSLADDLVLVNDLDHAAGHHGVERRDAVPGVGVPERADPIAGSDRAVVLVRFLLAFLPTLVEDHARAGDAADQKQQPEYPEKRGTAFATHDALL